MKKIVLLLICIFTAAAALAQIKSAAKTFRVEGYGLTREEAVSDALRNAISQGVGYYIDSKLIVKNREMVFEEVKTRAQGYTSKQTVVYEYNPETKTIVLDVEVRGLNDLKSRIETSAKRDTYSTERVAKETKEAQSAFSLPGADIVKAHLERTRLIREHQQALESTGLELITSLYRTRTIDAPKYINESKSLDLNITLRLMFDQTIDTVKYSETIYELHKLFISCGAKFSIYKPKQGAAIPPHTVVLTDIDNVPRAYEFDSDIFEGLTKPHQTLYTLSQGGSIVIHFTTENDQEVIRDEPVANRGRFFSKPSYTLSPFEISMYRENTAVDITLVFPFDEFSKIEYYSGTYSTLDVAALRDLEDKRKDPAGYAKRQKEAEKLRKEQLKALEDAEKDRQTERTVGEWKQNLRRYYGHNNIFVLGYAYSFLKDADKLKNATKYNLTSNTNTDTSVKSFNGFTTEFDNYFDIFPVLGYSLNFAYNWGGNDYWDASILDVSAKVMLRAPIPPLRVNLFAGAGVGYNRTNVESNVIGYTNIHTYKTSGMTKVFQAGIDKYFDTFLFRLDGKYYLSDTEKSLRGYPFTSTHISLSLSVGLGW